jgi:hypothetical protein
MSALPPKSDIGTRQRYARRSRLRSLAMFAVSNLLPEDAAAGDSLCRGKLLPIIGWTEVAFEFVQGVAK